MTELTSTENKDEIAKPNFATKGERIGAYLTDSIAVGLIIFLLNYFNFTNFRSFPIYLIIALIGILYKPLTEYYFGMTLGKYALDMKVTNLNYEKMNFKQSFLRSSILLIAPILYIPIWSLAFHNQDLMSIQSFFSFTKALALKYPIQNMISYLSSLILIIDLIFMLNDKKKLLRALHDRIGKTYVIKTK